MRDGEWEAALPVAEKLVAAIPEESESEGGRAMLAKILRELDRTERERTTLMAIAERNADPVDALNRLIEIDSERQDQESILKWCEHLLEIDPLSIPVHEHRSTAFENLDREAEAIDSLTAILALEPIDEPLYHFRLARALFASARLAAASSQPELQATAKNHRESAKRHLLQALEESPRYRKALELLVEIHAEETPKQ